MQTMTLPRISAPSGICHYDRRFWGERPTGPRIPFDSYIVLRDSLLLTIAILRVPLLITLTSSTLVDR